VLQALAAADGPMSAAEVAAETGVSRATAQRYLAGLATSGDVAVGLRYGATGRPEQEFSVKNPKGSPSVRQNQGSG
jgi:response regulator of citrate/malate metabolism